MEAIKKLVDSGAKFLRTIHLVFMPDEEIGGTKGMQAFVEHEEFKKLNVEVALDEGIASPNDVFTVFYGERAAWCKHSTFFLLDENNLIKIKGFKSLLQDLLDMDQDLLKIQLMRN